MPTFQMMLINLAQSLKPISQLLVAFCYVFGFFCLYRSLIHLKIYGEMRVMMAASTSLKPTGIYWIMGTLFIFIPSTYESFLVTFFGDPIPAVMSYSPSNDLDKKALKTLIMVVQLFGLIAVARGINFLSHLTQQSQPGTLGKAINHMVAGTFAINIVGFTKVVLKTLGVSA